MNKLINKFSLKTIFSYKLFQSHLSGFFSEVSEDGGGEVVLVLALERKLSSLQ